MNMFGTPEGTRTPDLNVRSVALYPTELRAHTLCTAIICCIAVLPGFEPRLTGSEPVVLPLHYRTI